MGSFKVGFFYRQKKKSAADHFLLQIVFSQEFFSFLRKQPKGEFHQSQFVLYHTVNSSKMKTPQANDAETLIFCNTINLQCTVLACIQYDVCTLHMHIYAVYAVYCTFILYAHAYSMIIGRTSSVQYACIHG